MNKTAESKDQSELPSNEAQTDSKRQIIIAGGGIGGLAASLALSQRGWKVEQFEKADGFHQLGAGIQLSPNSVHVLRKLGVFEKILEVANKVEFVRIHSMRTGNLISEIPFGDSVEKKYGEQYFVAHRADLHSILLDACLHDENIQIRMSSTIADATADEDGITVDFNTADGLASQRGEALIGSDGVHSVVRRRLLRLPSAVNSGKVAYRTVISADQVPRMYHQSSYLWLGPNAHIVHYPIRKGQEINLVVIINDEWEGEDWSSPGEKQTILEKSKEWPNEVKELLNIPNKWLRWPLYSTDTSGIWVEGRMAVLGDAAHAMLPFLAQGGAMAIEDAWVLAKNLDSDNDVPTALLAYEEERRTRVDKVISAAMENGRLYHLTGIMARARDLSMRMMSSDRLLSRYDWLFNWKP